MNTKLIVEILLFSRIPLVTMNIGRFAGVLILFSLLSGIFDITIHSFEFQFSKKNKYQY